MKKVILSLSCFAVMASAFAQDCSKIFISEYVEGFGNNKAIEIYNPTDQPVNLSAYFLQRYNNGNNSAIPQGQPNAQTIQLPNDVLQPYQTYVIVLDRHAGNSTESDPKVWDELYAMADAHLCSSYATNNAMNFNGNDVVLLGQGNAAAALGPNHSVLDIIGKIGEDPGGNGTGGWSTVFPHNYSAFQQGGNTADVAVTLNHSLIRKAGIKKGFTTLVPAVFNPLLEWDSIPPSLPKTDPITGEIIYQTDGVTPQWVGNWSSLGWHNCDCAPLSVDAINLDDVKLYPNPTSGSFTITGVENAASIEVYNAVGQVIEQRNNNTQSTVSFSLEKTGIYMVKITDHNGRSATQKVVVK